MPADRLRVLVPALVALAMIIGSSLMLDWFVIEGVASDAFDLRESHSTAASTTFWVAVLFAIVVVMQVGARVLAGQVSHRFTRAGYLIGVTLFGNAFIAGYLLGPDLGRGTFDVEMLIVTRTWAPLMMLGGAIAGMVALYYAALEENMSTAIIDVKPDLAPARALPRKADMLKLEPPPDVVAKPASRPPSSSDGEFPAQNSGTKLRAGSSPDDVRESQRLAPASVEAEVRPPQRRRAPTNAEIAAEMSGTKLRAASSPDDVGESQRLAPSSDSQRTPSSDSQRTPTIADARGPRKRAPTNAEIAAEMSRTTLRPPTSSEGADVRESQRIAPTSTSSDVRESQRLAPSSDSQRAPSSDSQRTPRKRAPTNAEIAAEMSGTTLRAASSAEGAADGSQRARARTSGEMAAEMSGTKLRASSSEGSEVRESQRTAPTRPSSSSDVREPPRPRARTNADIAAEMSGVKLRAASSAEDAAPVVGRTATTTKSETPSPDKPSVSRTTTSTPTVSRTATSTPSVARTTTPDKPALARTATPPHELRGKLRYVALTAQLTRGGVDARREDGSAVLVVWRDVVGAVARRLPDELDGETFVDLVSTAGSTLRIVSWTRLEGDAITGDDRPLALLRYIVAHCPDITLDPATRGFIEGRTEAAQLPDVATLAAHDERLG